MSTIFTVNPIKVNLISITNLIKQTLVFIGTVPPDVKSELQKIESSKSIKLENKILCKFYGIHWASKIGIKHVKKGGNEFSFDTDENLEESLISEIAEEPSENVVNELLKITTPIFK